MMRFITVAAGALLLASCVQSDAPVDHRAPGSPAVTIAVQALTLGAIADAVFDLQVATPDGPVVAARVTSRQYGDGAGSVTFVAPCDASLDTNAVSVDVIGLYEAAVAEPGLFGAAAPGGSVDFQNPGRVTREVRCDANTDTLVDIAITLARPARQGFFDIAVSFDDVFCSAKYDCGTAERAIRLLHDASGQRGKTHVMGLACTAGPGSQGVETVIHSGDLTVGCEGLTPSSSTVSPSAGDGNLCDAGQLDGGGAGPTDCAPGVALPADGPLYQAAVFKGTEALEDMNKVYVNVALGVERELPAGTTCAVRFDATADNALSPALVGGAIPLGRVYPFIAVDLEDLGACASNHVLDEPGSAVTTTYTTTTAVDAPSFSHPFPSLHFTSVWDTSKTSAGSSGPDQIRLPLTSLGAYAFTVDWGDGTADHITAWGQAEATHTYAGPGVYTIAIHGQIEGFRFNGAGDRAKLLEVTRWGPLRLGDGGHYFQGASNMTITATDLLDLTGTTNFDGAFRSCHALTTVPSMNAWDTSGITTMVSAFAFSPLFDQPIGAWDVSQVTDFGGVFWGAHSFNQPIGAWDTSSARSLSGMFYQAHAFNQPIGAWDVSQVTNFTSLFFDATAFDQDIGSWDTGAVTTMHSTFYRATAFNQDIGGWDTGAVTTMHRTFRQAVSFDQDIGSWDVSNVESMTETFQQAAAFDRDIGGWDVSSVTAMNSMFRYASVFNQDLDDWEVGQVTTTAAMFFHAFAFNGEIGSWDVRNVISMNSMFTGATVFNRDIGAWQTESLAYANRAFYGANLFNQDISGWDVSGIQDMTRMFNDAFRFNQDISGWDVSGVTNMDLMFYRAVDFDQDLSAWDVSGVTTMRSMFREALVFDQDFGGWDVSSLEDATTMLDDSGLSTASYDSLLVGWDGRAGLRPDVPLGAFGRTYSAAAAAARQGLVDRGWVIDGDAPAE